MYKIYMYIYIYIHMYMYIYILRIFVYAYIYIRPTQSIIYVPLQVNRFQKSISLIVQYKYLKSCSGDFCSPESDPPHESCGAGFNSQSSWVFHFHLTIMVRWKCFVPQLYQLRRGISEGPSHSTILHDS